MPDVEAQATIHAAITCAKSSASTGRFCSALEERIPARDAATWYAAAIAEHGWTMADVVGLIAAARLALGIEVVPALGPCSTCGTPYSECEISADEPDYTTDANGNHEGPCCEDCGHHAVESGDGGA